MNGHRTGKWSIGSVLMLCLLLCACNEDSHDGQEEMDLLQLTSYTHPLEEAGTRAMTVPEGYFPFEDVYHTQVASSISFGIFMVSDAPSDMELITYRGNDTWQSFVAVKQQQYHLYGFIPAEAASSANIAYLDSYTRRFEDGAILSINGLSAVSAADLCVVVGVKGAESADESVNLQLGQFSYMGKPKGKNFAGLLLEHIYSAVDFKLKVDPVYYTLRRIKLKKMVLKTTTVSSVNATVIIQANQDAPIQSLSWTPSGGSGNEVTLYEEGDEELFLTTEPQLIRGFMSPLVNNRLTIESEYDVYDTQGNLVRENCKAENYLGSLISQDLKSGQKSVVTLTVNPTYLYVLSDPDLDNPTITVEN